MSVSSSKITNVCVYVGRAEITTVYTPNVKTGHKIVHIEELPDTMNRESLRCVVSSFLVDSFLNRCVESKDVGALPSTISKLSDEKSSASEWRQKLENGSKRVGGSIQFKLRRSHFPQILHPKHEDGKCRPSQITKTIGSFDRASKNWIRRGWS
jgi:hypothetical protein